MIPGNPHAQVAAIQAKHASRDASAVAQAVLALAYEQHQRNRLAAITATHRGLTLPPDLEDLTTEGAPE